MAAGRLPDGKIVHLLAWRLGRCMAQHQSGLQCSAANSIQFKGEAAW